MFVDMLSFQKEFVRSYSEVSQSAHLVLLGHHPDFVTHPISIDTIYLGATTTREAILELKNP